MITEVFPVSINGVKYRIAEDMEQAGYQLHRQPLRAPVNGFIQGESGRFQLRPDILEWSMTDWSGGEGTKVFNEETPSSYAIGWNVDPFSVYGTLRLSGLASEVVPGAGSTALGQGQIVSSADAVWFVGMDLVGGGTWRVYKYDVTNAEWDETANELNGTQYGIAGAWADSTHIYWAGNSSIRRWSAGGGFQNFSSATRLGVLAGTGGYLYSFDLTSQIAEFDPNATLPVTGTVVMVLREIREVSFGGVPMLTAGIGGASALYVAAAVSTRDAIIYKITPTTAAGTGFGNELLRLPGFRALALAYGLGVVYILGVTQDDRVTVFQFDEATEEYSVLYSSTERLVNHTSAPSRKIYEAGAGSFATDFTKTYFLVMGGPNNNNGDEWTLMTLDHVSGGVSGGTVIAVNGVFDDAVDQPLSIASGGEGVGRHSVAVLGTDVLTCLTKHQDTSPNAAGSSKTHRFRSDRYTLNTGILHSGINDFRAADEKVLLSITVNTEPLAANARVVVKYQLDQDGSWLTAGTHDTDGATAASFAISTGSVTRSFRNLQVRLELDNNLTDTVTPVVLSVRVHATIIKGVKVWDLLLDATDEDGQAQDRSWNGTSLINNIEVAGDSGAVVTFLDGYEDRNPGQYTTHNVVVDEYRIMGDRPGEGHIMVRLRETT